MKKIPTLFVRVFDEKRHRTITREVTKGLEWVLEGEGLATEKIDGSCSAIINDHFYKRYDAKWNRKAPEGAIPCCEPDPITGHWPHWVLVDENKSCDKWYVAAYKNTENLLGEGTYEAIGPHFQGNPYHLDKDILVKHGMHILPDVPRDFDGIKEYLSTHNMEGIVFWKDDKPQCKIKRSDFHFEWPMKEESK